MQKTCTRLQRDNHTNTSSLNFYGPDALPDAQPCQSTEGIQLSIVTGVKQVIALRRQDDMTPPPADGSSTRGGSMSAHGRVHSLQMAMLQAASMPTGLGSCASKAGTDRRTGGQTDRRIVVLLNAQSPYGGGHNKYIW